MAPLRVEVRGPTCVAWLDGELDISNTRGVRDELAAVVRNSDNGLVLELSGLSYLDSAGLGMLFSLSRQLRDRQQTLLLVVPDAARIRRLLVIARIATVAQIHPTLAKALA